MLGGGSGDNAIPAAGWILVFLGYVAVSTVFFLARAAVIHGANMRMDGGDPSVGSALHGASGHWPAVAGFAAISVTVGLVLQAVRENGGIVGAIVSWIGDVAWSVLTYLVLPVIVIEGVGTVAGIKGSSALVKRTWGEQVTANVGFGLLNLALVLPAIAWCSSAARWAAWSLSWPWCSPSPGSSWSRRWSPPSPASSRLRSTARPPAGPSRPSSTPPPCAGRSRG